MLIPIIYISKQIIALDAGIYPVDTDVVLVGVQAIPG